MPPAMRSWRYPPRQMQLPHRWGPHQKPRNIRSMGSIVLPIQPMWCPRCAISCPLLGVLANHWELAYTLGKACHQLRRSWPKKQICRWEFADMAELLPEFWSLPSVTKPKGHPSAQPSLSHRSRKVTDLALWVQRFASYVGVLAGLSPEAASELIAQVI